MEREELHRLLHIFGPQTTRELYENLGGSVGLDEIEYTVYESATDEQVYEDAEGRVNLSYETILAMLEED